MASRDVQDILGISADITPKPRPKKKAKVSVPRPDGITREVLALYGERAPPIPVEALKYKAKRSLPTTKISWQKTKFSNQARTDGLLLRHWHQKQEPIGPPSTDGAEAGLGQQHADEANSNDLPSEETRPARAPTPLDEGDYRFAKYDIQIEHPRYDTSQYDTLLRSEQWSQEETEYLMELHKDYFGKWPIIADRYDFKPSSRATDANARGDIHIFQERSMEDMKARFYQVSARLMAAHTPVSNMTTTEFDRHEKMTKFNPRQEAERKRQKEALLARSREEKREEDYLLAELRRIYARARRAEDERADLRERLDHSLTDAAPAAPSYTTSVEINALFQKMWAKDKAAQKARRPTYDAGAGAGPSPSTANQTAGSNAANQPGAQQKRGSIAGGGTGATPTASRRVPLAPHAEARFGVTTHERLTSGVTFRSDKLAKARQAKSAAQTAKIAGMLAELQVPELLQMASLGVCAGMERLVGKVGALIEARRMKEKEENDVKVARQLKGVRGGGGGGGGVGPGAGGQGGEAREEAKGEGTGDGDGDAEGDVEMADADASANASAIKVGPSASADNDQENSRSASPSASAENDQENQNGSENENEREEDGKEDSDDDNDEEEEEEEEDEGDNNEEEDDDDDNAEATNAVANPSSPANASPSSSPASANANANDEEDEEGEEDDDQEEEEEEEDEEEEQEEEEEDDDKEDNDHPPAAPSSPPTASSPPAAVSSPAASSPAASSSSSSSSPANDDSDNDGGEDAAPAPPPAPSPPQQAQQTRQPQPQPQAQAHSRGGSAAAGRGSKRSASVLSGGSGTSGGRGRVKRVKGGRG